MAQGYNWQPLSAGLNAFRQQQNLFEQQRMQEAQQAQNQQYRNAMLGQGQQRIDMAQAAAEREAKRAAAIDPLRERLLRTQIGAAERAADPLYAYKAREQAAARFGLQPNTPEYKAFTLTGKMPKSQAFGPYENFKDRVQAGTTVRKEFAGLSKTYRDVADAYQRVTASQTTPAGDVALIFNYMKMLDPGSVVREGEFATAEQTAGVPGRIVNLYNKIIQGQRLTLGQRQQFIDQARRLFEVADKRFITSRDRYTALSQRLGLDPRNTVQDFGEGVRAPAPPSGSGVPGTVVTPPGNQPDPLGIR